jgi:hypothetical protein
MNIRIYSQVLCTLLFAGSIFSHPVPAPLPSNEEGSYDSESFHNPVNNLYICIFSPSDGESNSGSFLQLRQSPNKNVITSLRCDWGPGFDALWSPDGKHVAISYKDLQSGRYRSTVYAVSHTSLDEILNPQTLMLRSFLQKNDPAWKLYEYAETTRPRLWLNNSTLLFTVSAVFKNLDSGFTNIEYEVVEKLQHDSSLKIESSKQTEYKAEN